MSMYFFRFVRPLEYLNKRDMYILHLALKITRANFIRIFVHVLCGPGSVLPRRYCHVTFTSGFVDEVVFFHWVLWRVMFMITTRQQFHLHFRSLQNTNGKSHLAIKRRRLINASANDWFTTVCISDNMCIYWQQTTTSIMMNNDLHYPLYAEMVEAAPGKLPADGKFHNNKHPK